MEHLLVVEMYAVCVLQITVLLVPLGLFSGTLHELIKLLISAHFHLILRTQDRVELSLYMLQMHMMNVKYSSSFMFRQLFPQRQNVSRT